MLVSITASSALPRTREHFSVTDDEPSQIMETTPTKNGVPLQHEPILAVPSTRTTRNSLKTPSSGFTWIDGPLFPVHDIFYLSDGNSDDVKVSEPDDNNKFNQRFDASPEPDIAVQESLPTSFIWSNPKTSSDQIENAHYIQRNVQTEKVHPAIFSVSDLHRKEKQNPKELSISVKSQVPSFLTDLVPPNPENFVVRHAFDITDRSAQKHIPVKESDFQLNEKREEDIAIFSPEKGEHVKQVEVSLYTLPKYISETVSEFASNKKEGVQSSAQFPFRPEELYRQSVVNPKVKHVTPKRESDLPVMNIPLREEDFRVHDVRDLTISDIVLLKNGAVQSPSKEGELSSTTINSLSSIEYIPIEEEYPAPSLGSLLSIEPSYTRLPDSEIETIQPTPPLPSRAKSSPTFVAQLSEDEINITVVHVSESLSSEETAMSIFTTPRNPLPINGLVSKSAVAHLLDLEVNRYEEKERSHPALLNLSPVAQPEYNKVSLLNRLKKLSNSKRILQNRAVGNSSLTDSARNSGFQSYFGGKFEGAPGTRDGLPSACDCAPRISYKTFVVVDDEVIGTYGPNGFRKRNFDFGTAWRNFPTTTIEWPASVISNLSTLVPPCPKVTSVSTETYYHTQSEPHCCIAWYLFSSLTSHFIMAPRFERFVDSSGKVLISAGVTSVAEKMEEDFISFESIMEEERKLSTLYADAWTRAEELYESKFKASISPKDAKIIDTEMPEKLPASLKNTPSHVPIAVLVVTQEEHQEFVVEFNEATQIMMESSDWPSFKFKSLFMLLSLAQRHLFSRPNRDLKKVIFRSVASEWDLQKDQTISFGYYASFTVRRGVAMDVKEEDGDAEGDKDNSEASSAALRPTLVKMEFTPSVSGLGVKHLSPFGENEREVIVSPLQNFQVVEVLQRKKKGFTIYTLKPAEE
ncbi:NAD:arginine ADP-ribosyltransferase ART [Trinorchestia longiramus]|nr:NAD:arginine ADP-ribosyltransferase ART [Trinorchestia longiramus]